MMSRKVLFLKQMLLSKCNAVKERRKERTNSTGRQAQRRSGNDDMTSEAAEGPTKQKEGIGEGRGIMT